MAEFRPMTAEERVAALGLAKVRVDDGAESLARSLINQAKARTPTITDKQAAALWNLCWTYRRQLTADVVRDAKAKHATGEVTR